MRTSIYIDGFNLYYGAVKGTPYKWLDFHAAFTMLLQPQHRITAINYFTAQVSASAIRSSRCASRLIGARCRPARRPSTCSKAAS